MFTDEKLTRDQMTELREAVKAQSQRQHSGGIPIFSHGLKWESMSLTSQDAQLVEAFGMTVEDISRAFRVPLALINDMRQSTFSNSEAMMTWFLSSGLGFMLEHIELELGRLFNLPFNERVNFDTTILLRSDWKTRIETLGEGVLKGIYSPNEARARAEGLPPAVDGDEPRVQQQVVPLSAWEQTEPEPVVDNVADFMAGVKKGLVNE
jgi:HK97 family phage portal protein